MWDKIKNAISIIIGKINWTTRRTLDSADLDVIRQKLKDNYYVILTRHNGHLSTYAIGLAHRFLTGKPGYYGHACMNMENEVTSDDGYEFMEATGEGVHYSGFPAVFDQQIGAVALLKPKSMTIDEWTACLDRARTEVGKPYDTLFNLADDKALSCVELVRDALSAEPNYKTDFVNFEAMISKGGNLDPQMFYECPDFEIAYEVRR
jgi:uncharacterized protein YycO